MYYAFDGTVKYEESDHKLDLQSEPLYHIRNLYAHQIHSFPVWNYEYRPLRLKHSEI